MTNCNCLDDQLDVTEVVPALRRWVTVARLRDLRPHEQILDDRVPEILRTLNRPTFITIDPDFWDRRLCHQGYAIIYFAISDDRQEDIPRLLRALFRRREFGSRGRRMGMVARVTARTIVYWRLRSPGSRRIIWSGFSKS